MLTGNEIRIQVKSGNIKIEPYDPENIGPNSYDVRLADELAVYIDPVLDVRRENRTRKIKIPEEGIKLVPGKVYLGSTVEYTESPAFVPMYEGRSSLARLGISSHLSAGFGDIGFKGKWTLEIKVEQPVIICAGIRIGQLYWHKPVGEITSTYHGKYQGQMDATPSRLFQDREWEEENDG